jgi:hypothetical protein
MKCIDAIEGTVKCILKELHVNCTETGMDDSDYISRAKSVIEATDRYIRNNPELIEKPELLKQVLYVYSRNLWIIGQQPAAAAGKLEWERPIRGENEDYQTYYYDYLYDKGLYPG